MGYLYDWAGKVRSVNISKDGMFFAPVEFLDNVLKDFSTFLTKELSKPPKNKLDLSQKLATIHNEFNIIHPFREGNGRTIRLFLDLLAASFGYNPIGWNQRSKVAYFKACVFGANGDKKPLAKIIEAGLKKR